MSNLDDLLLKKISGKKLSDLHVPTIAEVQNRALKQLSSRYPLRELGTGTEGKLYFTEEDRESHIHILGSPGEGKSKFLEHLIRQDIDRGYGACLLDPSDNGDTAYKILRYCAKIRFEKVCLIDPHHRYSRKVKSEETAEEEGWGPIICGLNPFTSAPPEIIAEKMMDTSRILWDTKDAAHNAMIETYFPAVLFCLHKAGMTLAELDYFLNYHSPRRDQILDKTHVLDSSRKILDEAFSDKSLFKTEYRSTMRRMIPFLQSTIKLMLGTKESVNFTKMITEGWLILVNLDPQGIFGSKHQRLLGTLIINEIIYAIHRLRETGWKGVYYFYIDEVGDYATPKLAEILLKKRKSGLRFTLAHQAFYQIGDMQVLNAIYTGTKTKILFNTKNPEDQKKMIAMMYGGQLNSEETRYALMQLKKQHAVIKVDKGEPAITRIPDVPDINIDLKVLADFISKLYRQPWYHHPETVLQEINARFRETKPGRPRARTNEETRSDTQIPVRRTEDDRKPARKPTSGPRPKGNVEALFAEAGIPGPAGKTPDSRRPSQPRKRKGSSPKQGADSAGGSPPLGQA